MLMLMLTLRHSCDARAAHCMIVAISHEVKPKSMRINLLLLLVLCRQAGLWLQRRQASLACASSFAF